MTARDSLEKIVEEMRARARGVVIFDPSGENIIPDREWMNLTAARISALIPSKAEREFLEAAMEFCEWKASGNWEDDVASGHASLVSLRGAYRALLAERGKDA